MNYKPIYKILSITCVLTFVVSVMYVSFIIMTPSQNFTQGDSNATEEELNVINRNVLLRETLLLTSVIGMLLSVSLFILFIILNRKYHEDLPIVQNNSVDRILLVSLAFLLISPVFIITLMYTFTLVMNVLFY